MTLPLDRVSASLADQLLPSGRVVALKVGEGQERTEVRSPQGEIEVHITLTSAGPGGPVTGCPARTGSCRHDLAGGRRLQVHTTEATHLASEGQVRITGKDLGVGTTEDIRLDGTFIRLNCEKIT